MQGRPYHWMRVHFDPLMPLYSFTRVALRDFAPEGNSRVNNPLLRYKPLPVFLM